jgi:hypothetical protein
MRDARAPILPPLAFAVCLAAGLACAGPPAAAVQQAHPGSLCACSALHGSGRPHEAAAFHLAPHICGTPFTGHRACPLLARRRTPPGKSGWECGLLPRFRTGPRIVGTGPTRGAPDPTSPSRLGGLPAHSGRAPPLPA